VSHDGDGPERVLRQEDINSYRLSNLQGALHEGTQAAFTDVEGDTARRPDTASGQMMQRDGNAE